MTLRLGRRLPAAVLLVILAGCVPAVSPLPSAPGPAPTSVASQAAPSAAARLPLVIDTDMAPDDVVAIASLLRDPSVNVLAITVTGTGEAHCPGGMFVARAVVTMLVSDPITVACGRSEPFGAAQPFPDEWRAGADVANGLRLVSPAYSPDPRRAEEVLVDLAAAEAAAGRRLTILTLGPLTNLASAVALDPTFAGRVTVVAMLGAVDVPGNVQPDLPSSGEPTAEWNAHADPTAVRLVLEAGFDILLVGLDATNDVPLRPELFAALEADHVAGPADLVFELWARNTFMVGGDYYIWDPLTAVVVRNPGVVTTRPARLRVVEGAGLNGGRLVEDPAGAPVTIATSADRERFESALLASLRIGEPRAGAFVPVGVVTVVAGAARCEVAFDPTVLRAGLLRLDLTADAMASAVMFGTAGIPWADLEAFVRNGDPTSPPPVDEFAAAFLEAAGSASSWGDAHPGEIGIACFSGTFDAPEIVLRGPFQVAP